MGGILSTAPLDLVDLLFDLEGLEVIELGLVGLELGVELVLAGFFLLRWLETARYNSVVTTRPEVLAAHRLVALKQDDPPALVASCQIIARMVEFNGRYDVG